MKTAKDVRPLLLLLMALLVGYGCDSADSAEDTTVGAEDTYTPDSTWTPPETTNCTGYSEYGGYEGYGDQCVSEDAVVSPCAGFCIHGVCDDTSGVPLCSCEYGYAGERCDTCDDGFAPSGLQCVVAGECEEDPCVYGDCVLIDGERECICQDGYAGDLCDTCADGYVPEGLACVPGE